MSDMKTPSEITHPHDLERPVHATADPRPPRENCSAFVEWLLRRYCISEWDNQLIRRLKLVLKRDNDGNLLPEGKLNRDEKKGIAVTARSQDGKTTLVCQVLKRLFNDSFTEHKCGEKIAYCRLKGEATIKSVSQDLCRTTGFHNFPEKLTRPQANDLAVHRLRMAGIKIVIIDEVHNLMQNRNEPADLYLKNLAQEEGFCVILIGTIKAWDFIYGDPENEELAERYYDFPLIPFDRPKAIELINGALQQFSRDAEVKLGRSIRKDPYFADRIYDGVQGSFGRCITLVASSVVLALEEGGDTVEIDDFREFFQMKYARLLSAREPLRAQRLDGAGACCSFDRARCFECLLGRGARACTASETRATAEEGREEGMRARVLSPHLPFHEDEVSQGYFARTGYFHAGVPVGMFCRYAMVDRTDFRNGTDSFSAKMGDLAGAQTQEIAFNTLRLVAEEKFQLRGEMLGLPIVRRTFVRFCPHCLQEDVEERPAAARGVQRFRWAWLLRPVVICVRHGALLTELHSRDPVNAFDLPKLIAEHDFRIPPASAQGVEVAGALQKYIEDRIWGNKNAVVWLDAQAIASGAKACEMLGALIDGGPNAPIGGYSEVDWARVGDIGFQICSLGPDAILDALGQLRIGAGRRSGRAGPQAAYGFLFRWINHTQRSGDFDPLRQILRDAILDNFAVGPGEVVLGQEIKRRRVHSVNSLVSATGINRFRLYRLMRKAGMIPDTADTAAFNQWVFPAEEGQSLIDRIQNSVPLNQVPHVLGCSKTHAEQLAHKGLIASVVPIAEGTVGLTQGHFNRDDLVTFMSAVLQHTEGFDAEEKGYVDLTTAARPRSSTVEILRWQLKGKLPGTRLLHGIQRLDHLRFDHAVVKALVSARQGPDLHRLTSVAVILGIPLEAVKRLITCYGGGPWLVQAPPEDCVGLNGGAYVSSAEIERFQKEYTSIAMIGRSFGLNARSVQRMLGARGICPTFDPAVLGSRIYRQSDVAGFLAELGGATKRENPAVFRRRTPIFTNNGCFGESDDTYL